MLMGVSFAKVVSSTPTCVNFSKGLLLKRNVKNFRISLVWSHFVIKSASLSSKVSNIGGADQIPG